ncbi:MAG: metallophosphoesterase family protein [Tepidiformaceae bacterium]
MRPLRFVHTADLHLDSPFEGLRDSAPQHVRDVLLQATFRAYERIIELCVAEKVDALLVAGDVYDGADRSLPAQLRFIEGLKRLDAEGIRSFVVHGNHDPLEGWRARLAFPASCHQFGAEVEAVPFDPALPGRGMVYGVSYPRQVVRDNLALRFRRGLHAGPAIGLLHCNVGSNTGHEPYSPCTVEDLVASGMDYWALGHVHTRQVLRAQTPTIVYPGSPQGRHPNERGERGVYVVELGDGETRLDFRALDVVRWATIEVDIAALGDEQALLDTAEFAVEAARSAATGRDLMYRLVVSGRGPLHEAVRRPQFANGLQEHLNAQAGGASPFAWCSRVAVETRVAIDRDALCDAGDFTAEVLGVFDRSADDAELQDALDKALSELFSHHAAGKLLGSVPTGAARAALLRQAEERCLEELLQ